jgi:hypothetical protein
MLIGGKWVESASGEVLEVEDPAHRRPIAEVPRGRSEDVVRAVNAADAAFHAWSRTIPRERGRLLLRIADALERSPRQPMRKTRAVRRNKTRHRRHDHEADQRDEAEGERQAHSQCRCDLGGIDVPITIVGTIGFVLAGLPHEAQLLPLSCQGDQPETRTRKDRWAPGHSHQEKVLRAWARQMNIGAARIT